MIESLKLIGWGRRMRWGLCGWVLALSALVPLGAQAQDQPDQNVTHRVRGKYLYRTLKEQKPRGQEEWLLTVHPDGSKILRTTVRIAATGVLRDVVHMVDANSRPKETYMVLWVEGQFIGSALYSVSGNRMEVIVNSPTTGRLTQEVTVPDQFSMISHPVAGDGWHFWYYDEATGGLQTGTGYNPDTLGKGPGSILGKLQPLKTRLVGTEEVTTPAGTFQTRHFELAEVFQVWVSDHYNMMVRMTLPAADLEYLLTEYVEEK